MTVQTKLYTRDEVQKLSHKAIGRAIKSTLNDFAEADIDTAMIAAIGLGLVKMASTADRKLSKLLDKAEGKK